MRGVVALVAALSLPLTLADGSPTLRIDGRIGGRIYHTLERELNLGESRLVSAKRGSTSNCRIEW